MFEIVQVPRIVEHFFFSFVKILQNRLFLTFPIFLHENYYQKVIYMKVVTDILFFFKKIQRNMQTLSCSYNKRHGRVFL